MSVHERRLREQDDFPRAIAGVGTGIRSNATTAANRVRRLLLMEAGPTRRRARLPGRPRPYHLHSHRVDLDHSSYILKVNKRRCYKTYSLFKTRMARRSDHVGSRRQNHGGLVWPQNCSLAGRHGAHTRAVPDHRVNRIGGPIALAPSAYTAARRPLRYRRGDD